MILILGEMAVTRVNRPDCKGSLSVHEAAGTQPSQRQPPTPGGGGDLVTVACSVEEANRPRMTRALGYVRQ